MPVAKLRAGRGATKPLFSEEGDDTKALFEDFAEGEQGKIKWRGSEAKRLLYEDVKNGV
jgi:hypothetical protein